MSRIITISLLACVSALSSGCCALSTVIGPTTRMYGTVVDQNGDPVPYCPLVGDWEHRNPFPWIEIGHARIIMSDANGKWEFKRRGVASIFVKVGKDCHQREFPGYNPALGDKTKEWLVSGHPKELGNPYTISVVVDRKAAARPFTPEPQDYLGDQYKKLRQQHPAPYPEPLAVQDR